MNKRSSRNRPSVSSRSGRLRPRHSASYTHTRTRSTRGAQHAPGRQSKAGQYVTPSIQSQPESLPKQGLTRRQLILGGAGAAALLTTGSFVVSGISKCSRDVFDENALDIAKDDVFGLEDCNEISADDVLEKFAEITLPYRSLIWAATDAYATCLLPSQDSVYFASAGILHTVDARVDMVLEKPISTERGWDIYDFRCSDRGAVWLEANAFTKAWRIYHATYIDETFGTPTLAREGNTEYEIPHILAVEGRAFWQMMPPIAGDEPKDCLVESVRFGGSEIDEVMRTSRRFATPPYAASEGIVITPRSAEDSSSYKVSLISTQSLEEIDSIVLPAAMAPMEAGFAGGRFSVAFDAIYAYENGFSNLGTYVPVSADSPQEAQWFRFDRNPSAQPAWCNDMLVVKSTYAVSFIDIAKKTYFALSVPSDSDDFGDYLASSGTRAHIITYAHINNAEDDPYTLVRFWRPVV